MDNPLSLSQYVRKRNGVPLGDTRSMRNMLYRSLGAKSFAVFWRYWNPIWGYYLSRNVMRPLNSFLPVSVATIFTFIVSGALHDLAVGLIKWKSIVFFTPWFGIMGVVVVISSQLGISYGKFTWPIRAVINLATLGASLYAAYHIESGFV